MKELSDAQAKQMIGGATSCGYHIVVSATVGGLFGGAGAAIGAVIAATGPSCLGWW
ncbi:hypothetical protein LJ707_02220 [Mucilaginibacter sp. UR6-1]|uniref:hypothetical protein n=1 Tax=Mucilaginibacter sp. UR6-1 TaxID=1435643 RepID=UPI001E4FA422|nr:hypothetical protein [Mucilaginibacter sp. UR6-1]MCC8407727.1 hypothetical protein [Mucilaginibacter sp. UR6-1]